MSDHPIKQNKLRIFGLLQAIEDGAAKDDHVRVEAARINLSLLAELDVNRPDELTQATRKVFDLSGRWDRGVDPNGAPAIAAAVEAAIARLNKPDFE